MDLLISERPMLILTKNKQDLELDGPKKINLWSRICMFLNAKHMRKLLSSLNLDLKIKCWQHIISMSFQVEVTVYFL